MDRELIIKLGLDKSQATAVSAQFTDEQRAQINQLLAEFDAAEQKKTASARKGAQQRSEAGTQALGKEREAVGETEAAHNRLRDMMIAGARAGAQGIAGITSSLGASLTAANLLTQGMRDLAAAIDSAAQKREALTKSFQASRDDLAELAMLMGKSPDTGFTLDIAKFNEEARQRPEEGRAFLTELYNSGAQFKGKNLSDREFDQFAIQTAQLAAAKGLARNEMGNLAGSVLGFRNFGQGDQASEQALGTVNQAMAVLGRGKGNNAVLLRQFGMLASASLNEEALKGTFQNPTDVAAVVSAAAEKHDAQAFELAMQAARGLRGFGPRDKQRELLKSAGIGADTGFIAAVQKLAPVVQAQAQAKGLKIEDVLRQSFSDVGTAEALSVFINKGVFGGVFQDRAQFAQTVAGPAPALASIDQFLGSERGLLRGAEANRHLEELTKGMTADDLGILRVQAEARLRSRGELDTTLNNVQDMLAGGLTLGLAGNFRQRRIDETALGLLRERAPGMAMPGGFALFPEQMESLLHRNVQAARRGGVNPLREFDRGALPADGQAVTAELSKQTELLQKISEKLGNKQAPPMAGRPAVQGR